MPWPFSTWIENIWHTGLRASVEGLYPPDPGGAPDGVTTDLYARHLAYIRSLPPSHRFLLPLLFFGIELLPLLLSPWAGRFSRRTPQARAALITSWREGRVFALRGLGDALRATLQMVYLSHPSVLRHMGEYKTVAYLEDKLDMPIHDSPDMPRVQESL
jgi:hypothetical protein